MPKGQAQGVAGPSNNARLGKGERGDPAPKPPLEAHPAWPPPCCGSCWPLLQWRPLPRFQCWPRARRRRDVVRDTWDVCVRACVCVCVCVCVRVCVCVVCARMLQVRTHCGGIAQVQQVLAAHLPGNAVLVAAVAHRRPIQAAAASHRWDL